MARNGGGSWRRRAEKIEDFVEHLPPPLLTSDSEQVHVLAVDDSLVDRKCIERLLKISSCKVTAVDSGRRALQYLGLDGDQRSSSVRFDKMKVDMIITDYCMPGMTGYELLKKIKESSTFREIPVVIMSSENVLARISRCLENGAEDFIVKPVQLSDVRRLTDYMMREIKVGDEEERKITKRKLREDSSCDPASSSPSVSSSRSSSPTQPSSYPSPLSSSSPSPSPNPPSSPTSLDTPIRRLKMTTID